MKFPKTTNATPTSSIQTGSLMREYIFSFAIIPHHTTLHKIQKTIEIVSFTFFLLHSIPKQIQAVTTAGNKNCDNKESSVM